MFKVGFCGTVVVLGLGVGGCGQLQDFLEDLAHHHGGRPDGGGAACPLTGCASTTPIAGTTLRSVWIAPSGEVWTAGDAGLTGRRSHDGDWCWCVQPSGAKLNGVWGSADDDVWMVGDAGTALHWTGSAFQSVPDVAPGRRLAGVSGTGAGDVWAVGEAGTIRHFDGTSWSALDASSAYTLFAVWTPDPVNVWIGGRNPTVDAVTGVRGAEAILLGRTASGWTTTVAFAQGKGDAFVTAIDGISPNDVWAVGHDQPAGAAEDVGGAVHFDGTSWTEPATPSSFFGEAALDGVAAGTPDAPHGAWMVGGRQGIRTDGPGAWTKSDNPLLSRLHGIDARGDAMFAVGPDLRVARWNGTDWTADFGPVAAP